jgi:AraC family transcriptional regulator
MKRLVPPDDIPHWIPGELTLDSSGSGWNGMTLKAYRYADLHVAIPTMRDYMIVVYEGEPARMGRRSGGPWEYHQVEPGVVSLLTRAEQSEWAWSGPIAVSHVYLSHEAITKVAGDIYDRDIADVEIGDKVRAVDNFLPAVSQALRRELSGGEIGGRLMVETLRTQACVHVLRRFAQTRFREPKSSGIFTRAERRLLTEYLAENLTRDVSVAEMAGVVGLSEFHFSRKFRAGFGCPPHRWLMEERVRRAGELIRRQGLPLKEVAVHVGFADQSHMTRLFRRLYGITPAEYRRTLV